MKTKSILFSICINLCFVLGHIEFKPTLDSKCTTTRDIFANASSEFIKCSIEFSRPILFCENCVDEYVHVLDSYYNMSQVAVNGTACIDYFVNVDRLGIVQSLYDSSVNLWKRAKCYECCVVKDGVQTNIKSNETIKFNDFYQEFMYCLNRTDEEGMCYDCEDYYFNLQDYFFSISNENEKIGVCMDIVDKMNSTWIYWGANCCKFRRHPEYAFLGSTALVAIVTILFYVLAQYCSKQKTPTIIQQTRFAEVLNNVSQKFSGRRNTLERRDLLAGEGGSDPPT